MAYKRKVAYELAKAEARGRLKGQQMGLKLEPIEQTVRKYFDKILEKIDPLEAMAIMGATIMIKQGIDFTEMAAGTLARFPSTFKMFPWAIPIPGLATLDTKDLVAKDEILQWLLSFSIAFVLIKHFDKVVTAGGSLLSAARALVGIVV